MMLEIKRTAISSQFSTLEKAANYVGIIFRNFEE